jgi:hypothetical protein
LINRKVFGTAAFPAEAVPVTTFVCRIKGHSTKGMSCTDKNTMVFVVLEGEITVILHTTQFNAKKGDSFYIPPKVSFFLFFSVLRIRIHVFGPPGSGSISQRYGSGSFYHGSFYHHAKLVRKKKTLIPTIL